MLGPAYYAQVFTYNAFEHCFQNTYAHIISNMPANFIILNKQTTLLEFIHDYRHTGTYVDCLIRLHV